MTGNDQPRKASDGSRAWFRGGILHHYALLEEVDDAHHQLSATASRVLLFVSVM